MNWNNERNPMGVQDKGRKIIYNPYLKSPSKHPGTLKSSLSPISSASFSLQMKNQNDNDNIQKQSTTDFTISNPYNTNATRSSSSSSSIKNSSSCPSLTSPPHQPFGIHSKFSMGNKTDPKEFCSPYKRKNEYMGDSGGNSPPTTNNDSVTVENPYKKKSSMEPKKKAAAENETMENYASLHLQSPLLPWDNDTNAVVYDTNLESDPPIQNRKMSTNQDGSNHVHPFTFDARDTNDIPHDFEQSLTRTLLKNFGHASYRPGQLAILHSLLVEKRDAAVFWSTGSGKSICYQIPPLHEGKIGLVISPLISLMEDQVAKLNGLVGSGSGSGAEGKSDKQRQVAVFLGSGQKDPMAQERALRGEYALIYCTPEKLVSENGWVLDRLGELHHRSGKGDGICLIAVDESHCVSEWGHDFRRDYRQIGSLLRNHRLLQNIPILALTATAVPRVQQDIMTSLRLNNPKIVKQSFDRENLILTIKRKPPGGYKAALGGFVKEMKDMRKNKRFRNESTIVYCPTQSLVEEITAWLEQQFQGSDVRVQSYHGGQSMDHRTDAHINFLTGHTLVIVATLAFGMGIDKTDIR
jgi:ATP-dependent DNA helicase RecQ/Werner syndrome ATP-dependent helicase